MLNKRRPYADIAQITVLCALVLLSIFLTWQIVLSPGAKSSSVQNSSDDAQNLSQVFQPNQVFNVTSNRKVERLATASLTRSTKLRQTLSKATFRYNKTVPSTNKDIEKLLTTPHSLVLRYNDRLPLAYFNARYAQDMARDDVTFDYVVVPYMQFVNPRVYLVDSRAKSITTLTAKNLHQQIFTDELATLKAKDTQTVTFAVRSDRVQVTYPSAFSLPVYSYLVNTQDAHSYVNQLLGNYQIHTTQKGDVITYRNAGAQSLQVNADTRLLTFRDKSRQNTNLVDRLSASFALLNLNGMDLSNIRYFEARDAGKSIVYRTFVRDWPVFYQAPNGAVQVTDDQKLTAVYALDALTTPVPNSQNDVTLPNTATIQKTLTAAGISAKSYSDMTPGYQWQRQSAASQVVDLTPVWVLQDAKTGEWEALSEFIKRHQGKG